MPPTTLKDRLSGRVVHGTNPGRKPYLTTEEVSLYKHLMEATQAGYGKTRKQVKSIVENLAREKGVLRASRISDGWWRIFLERQPNLSLRRGDPTAHVWMNEVNQETIDSFYTLLEDILTEHNLLDKIYNMDASGMPLNHDHLHHSKAWSKKYGTGSRVTNNKSLF